jgi:hypothetical protein
MFMLIHIISDLSYKITLFQILKHHTVSQLLTNTELTCGQRDYTHIALDLYYIFTSTLFTFTKFLLVLQFIAYINESNIDSNI